MALRNVALPADVTEQRRRSGGLSHDAAQASENAIRRSIAKSRLPVTFLPRAQKRQLSDSFNSYGRQRNQF